MKPEFVDNLDGNTLVKALREVFGHPNAVEEENCESKVREFRVATAFFSPSGFARISSLMPDIPEVRILLGSDPIADAERWRRKLGEGDEDFAKRKLKERFERQEKDLRTERDHMPFSGETTTAFQAIVSLLEAGNIQVRRYTENFLHAKAYIFNGEDGDGEDVPRGIIAGSSNMTASGLSSNLELNLGKYDDVSSARAKEWFDKLWDQAEPYDLAALFREALEPRTPFEIFIRVLWELYGDEVEQDAQSDKNLPLTNFQKHGVTRAIRLIEECGGVIVADEVGLGKTFIAGEIMSLYQERRQRALLVCPAALRDSTWKNFIGEYQIYLETMSYEQLARDRQFLGEGQKHAGQSHLARNIDEYQLVIIDEAHNYRNPDSPNRAGTLRALLYGRRKDLLMLTATPVNNSLWDLYHLTRFFLKQDSFLAKKGILSIRDLFEDAMRRDPHNLSPDVLFPILDATTVKRTRNFVKKHYPNDQIKGPEGEMIPIVFPEPVAISVNYDLDDLHPDLFDKIEAYLDPDSPDSLTFARYTVEVYLNNPDPDQEGHLYVTTGLLRSGLLKRFESSTEAFRLSIERMIGQHERLLKSLRKGYVVRTEFYREEASSDSDEDFEQLLKESEYAVSVNDYSEHRLMRDVQSDYNKLRELLGLVKNIERDNDPKLKELANQLAGIAKQAKDEAGSRVDEIQKRKVLVFSYFADSARWIKEFLSEEIKRNPELEAYRGRIDMVVGSGAGEDSNKALAAQKFAPKTTGSATGEDLTDILVCTDVLAEGVNLQQCRHIINYDMPWNPMRLVQRHGRIDRIGSEHNRIFLRTFFPTKRLDALLKLGEKILRKIAMAAASIGVESPVEEASGREQVFSQTKEEIERLLKQDASLFRNGGTQSAAQSGEEYRQTLRKAMQENRAAIENMPWKSGSGMMKGEQQGMFFCAKVGDRVYLRFVHCDEEWKPLFSPGEEEGEQVVQITSEMATCLRLIECEPSEDTILTSGAREAAYEIWRLARKAVWVDWMRETDPLNLQPKVRPLNRRVAQFIRENRPTEIENANVDQALDILESPWPRRNEMQLKGWFEEDENMQAQARSKLLVENIIQSGLEPSTPPEPVPPIEQHEVELLSWLAISRKQNMDNGNRAQELGEMRD